MRFFRFHIEALAVPHSVYNRLLLYQIQKENLKLFKITGAQDSQ